MVYLQLFFNLILLALLARICSPTRPEIFFNPFISGPNGWFDALHNFFRPALRLPARMADIVLFALVFTIKTMLLYRIGFQSATAIGLWLISSPLHAPDAAPALPQLFAASAVESGLFIIRTWSAFLFISTITPTSRAGRAYDAFCFFTRPYSQIHLVLQPIVLLAICFGCCRLMMFCTEITDPEIMSRIAGGQQALPRFFAPAEKITAATFTQGPPVLQIFRTLYLAMLVVAEGLRYANQILFAAIIGSIVCVIFRFRVGMVICNECVSMVLARFRSQNIVGGGIDFVPLIYFFVVNIVYSIIGNALRQLITLPPSTYGL